MPRFVILLHEMPPGGPRGDHWDLMLETDAGLATWALEQTPDSAEPQTCRRLADHRADYLEYEGPLSGNRGSVRRWDRGEYQSLDAGQDRRRVRVQGEKLQGVIELAHDAGQRWTFSFASD